MPRPNTKTIKPRFPHRDTCTCTPCIREKEALARAAGAGKLVLDGKTKFDKALQEANPKDLGPMYADLPPLMREDKSLRARIAKYLAYKTEDPTLTNNEIAPMLGLTPHTLNTLISKAAKEGILVFDDPYAKFEHEILPNVVDNIAHFIKLKDRTMTIEAAKGGGVFKSHQAIKTEGSAPTTVLALKIETVDGPTKVSVGSIVGQPRQLEE